MKKYHFAGIGSRSPATTKTTKETTMFSLINCTPHRVYLTTSLMPGEVKRYASPKKHPDFTKEGWVSVERDSLHHSHTFAVAPSGFRLACAAVTSGPDLGCGVQYVLSNEAKAERERIWRAFEQVQGSGMIVIASEISVRCLSGSLDKGFASGFRVRAMWPVLAAESLRLPMGERWAAKLATLPADSRD